MTYKPEKIGIRDKYPNRKGDDTRYSWFNPAHVFLFQELERRILSLLHQAGMHSLERCRILEVGCGTGDWLRKFVQWGAEPSNLTGIDVLAEKVERARRLCPPNIEILCGSAVKLNFPDNTFDLVFQSTVFTSVQDNESKRQIAAEMMRVLRPHGIVIWYDFRVNNPWNPDVTGVGRAEIFRLFQDCHIELYPVTLAPPIVRILARWSWLLSHFLASLPWLCTHYLGLIRKNDNPEPQVVPPESTL